MMARPRGECWWCGRDYSLNADGLTRTHHDDGVMCPGAKKPHKAEVLRIAGAFARLTA